MGRTLVGTVLYGSKGKEIYCTAKKITDYHVNQLKATDREILEENGFTFISLSSPEYKNIKGYAIFFEGHIDEMSKVIKSIEKRWSK